MNNFWLEKKELKEEQAEKVAFEVIKKAIEKMVKEMPIEVFFLGRSAGITTNVCFFKDRIVAEAEVSKDFAYQGPPIDVSINLKQPENFQQELERVEAEGWVLDV